eukprot:5483208-Amphidinium_carterae.2
MKVSGNDGSGGRAPGQFKVMAGAGPQPPSVGGKAGNMYTQAGRTHGMVRASIQVDATGTRSLMCTDASKLVCKRTTPGAWTIQTRQVHGTTSSNARWSCVQVYMIKVDEPKALTTKQLRTLV